MSLSSSYGRPRPAGGRELWAWLFMRFSGLALILLALGHMVLMHLVHSVDEISYAFVAGRYAGWFWRGYDLLMLSLALVHGSSGLRILIDDYVHAPRWRAAALGALAVLGGGLLLLGAYVALCFRPVGA